MPSKNNRAIRAFLNALSDEKLKNFTSSEKTIKEDHKNGFRLDHQGVNADGSKKYRLYIQPIGGKSALSKGLRSNVIAQVHVTDPGDATEIREALWKSYKDLGGLVRLR